MKRASFFHLWCLLLVIIALLGMPIGAMAHNESDILSQYIDLGVNVSITTYDNKVLYGIYNTSTQSWKLNTVFIDQTEILPLTPPPDDVICLITVYVNDKLIGFREISGDAFYISLPSRLRGIESFDQKYSQYKPFGFDRYAYKGKNVLGFWDEKTNTILVNIDPETGGLISEKEDTNDNSTYIVAEYEDNVLIELREVSGSEFASIEGVIEYVEELREMYFLSE